MKKESSNEVKIKKKNEILVLLKTYKKSIIIIFAITFVIIPFAIHLVFYMPQIAPFFAAQWSAGEFLGFYGASLAAIGTVFLGLTAIFQNNELQKIMKSKEEKLNRIIKPDLYCDCVQYSESSCPDDNGGRLYRIEINVSSKKNTSCNIEIKNCTWKFKNESGKFVVAGFMEEIKAGESYPYCTYEAIAKSENVKIDFDVLYTDFQYNQRYKMHIESTCLNIDCMWRSKVIDDIKIDY